jgi:hypothetical protein
MKQLISFDAVRTFAHLIWALAAEKSAVEERGKLLSN